MNENATANSLLYMYCVPRMLFILKHYIKDLQHVHVHASMPCKLNQYMHACFARNYPKALSYCGHGHDLTSVAQLSVITSAFNKTLASEHFYQNAVDGAP